MSETIVSPVYSCHKVSSAVLGLFTPESLNKIFPPQHLKEDVKISVSLGVLGRPNMTDESGAEPPDSS